MRKRLNKTEEKLKQKLNYHYKYFDVTQIHPDPLEFPHRYKNMLDIEISAFISSVFAYGNVKQINNTLEIIFEITGNSPHNFILNYSENHNEFPAELTHRFYTKEDIHTLFLILENIYSVYGSIKYLFLLYYFPKDRNLKSSLAFFSENLLNIAAHFSPLSRGVKFMFPSPINGSACKRMNLFLRWMIRKDELDFGLWEEFSPAQLVIPVDTHVARICKSLKLTSRKNVSWKMAEEITENLKKFDAVDPVKYDFAICHLGMRKMRF